MGFWWFARGKRLGIGVESLVVWESGGEGYSWEWGKLNREGAKGAKFGGRWRGGSEGYSFGVGWGGMGSLR